MGRLTAGAPAPATAATTAGAAKPAPGPGSFELGGFTIWGVDGDTVTTADFAYDSAAKSLTVNTDKHFALQTDDQTIVEGTPSEDIAAGVHANPNTTSIIVPAGRHAHITLAGVGVRADNPFEISKGAACHLILADGTYNSFASTGNARAGIHNPTGATLTIDDSVPNEDIGGKPVIPVDGLIPANLTLANGVEVKEGDPISYMDSKKPGVLYALAGVTGEGNGAGIGGESGQIGGTDGEAGGAFTMYGGIVTARCSSNESSRNIYCGAGLGGGGWSGSGTGPNEWITINGGRLSAIAGYHGAGIGSGNAGATGNIRINGGYVISKGGDHGSGFGAACTPADSSAFKIVLTGGTLIPSTVSPPLTGCGDIGAPGADITITGGSIGNGRKPGDFSFSGSAHNAEGEPIKMIQVDLTSDVGENTYPITEWQLLVDGEPYDYGAPAEFDKGHLYLWLPEKVKQNSEVTVQFTYLDSSDLDENGNPTEKTPLPLFRPPGDTTDGKLRRYADFQLDDDYLAGLDKYYDGDPFPVFPLPLRTPDGRDLTQADKIKYKYQRLDASGNPTGAESNNGADAGTMRFTAISTQYSDDTEGNFSESYWGHRATGTCTIRPIASQVRDLAAEWVDDGKPGNVAHPSDQVLKVSAIIGAAPTVDGNPGSEATKATCRAPRGRVQIYVDGQPVGDPVDLVYADDPDAEGNPIPAGDARVTAEEVENGKGGSTTRFSLARAASTSDFLVPTQGQEGRHEISLQFLPPSTAQAAEGQPANYLASANPTEDPSAPRAEVAIDPIDPATDVIRRDDPDNNDPNSPTPEVSAGAPRPADPEADPGKPGDKIVDGAIVTTWGEPSSDNPHPGRVVVDIKTESSGPVSVVDANGNVFEADFVRGDDGEPVRNPDGSYTLVLDPVAVGSGKLTIRQEPNGAFTGTTWNFSVTVRPEPKIAPAPALSKKAENLTHPEGPTQPGDRIRYTVAASNTAAGSLWTDVVLTDPLPACLELDEGSVRLDNPSAGIEEAKLEKAASASPGDVGRFSLTAAGADGRAVLSAPAGDIGGGTTATLTFECVVREGLDFSDRDAVDLANTASAEGKRPNPDDPDGPDVGPVAPPDTDPATPPGGGTVAPADPDVQIGKTVQNITAPGAKMTRQGDVLRYTVTLANTGAADSCLMGAVISDPLPAGLEPVPGSLRLAVDGGESISVKDAAYDAGTRTIAVSCGDLWGGRTVVLTFDVTVGPQAAGADIGNVAYAHGSVPSERPDTRPEGPAPGDPVRPPTDKPVAATDPVTPPIVVGDDPAEGDVSIVKTAENVTRGDGTTRVGDTVRYTVTLRNDGAATSWMDAVIRDDVPKGLEPVSGTLLLTLPDGAEVAVDDAAYDHVTRRLAVAVGHLYGGQRVVLAFDALVTEDAVGADIGNVAHALGMPPSKWDPDAEFPEPGQPFDPPDGWETFDETRQEVESPAAYPPGTDAGGGVMAGTGAPDDSTTIRAIRLAQTGDALAAAAMLPLACALAAGAALLASRRRMRRAR